MHEQLSRQVSAMARAISKKTRGAGFAGAIVKLPGGKKGLSWAADEAAIDDLKMMVVALLNSIAERCAEGAFTCDGCAVWKARARAALASLTGDGTQPVPPHVH